MSAADSARPTRRAAFAPLLFGLLCLIVYNANFRVIGAPDTYSARYLPLALWHTGTLDLESSARLFALGHPLAPPQNRPVADGNAAFFEPETYWLIRTRDHRLASLYPIVAPLLAAPLYAPAALWLDARGWEQPLVDRVAEAMEKFSASLLAALAAVLMYLLLRREGHRWSVPLVLAFAFGTNTWMTSSQALWQHGSGELLIAASLLLVRAPANVARLLVLGAVCVLMAANRPPDALIALALGLVVLRRSWRDTGWLIAGAIVPAAAVLYYNLAFMGNLAGGYGMIDPPPGFLQQDWWGLAGLLLSPTHGLLVFAPFLVFVPVGLSQRLRAPETRDLALALGAAVLAQWVLYAHGDWRGGASWGPRWLTDLLPILVWMLAPAPRVLRTGARAALAVAMLLAIAIQAVGAFWYTKTSDTAIYASGPASMRSAWDPANLPFLLELRHAPARAALLCNSLGAIDRVGDDAGPDTNRVPELKAGVSIVGWALACGRAPSAAMLLVDGVIVGITREFQPRADVAAAMHTDAPSSWAIAANLWGVPPGERTLQLAVRSDDFSDYRIVRETRVRVTPQQPRSEALVDPAPSDAALAAMAAQATARLRDHQTAAGTWLTAHTPTLRYEAPQPEMNTFTPSVLIDLLAPVATRYGLDAMLARARTHLATQIERDGLVRYHGLPDAPTIGTLGCAITPDADDTALVWRIAGQNAGDARRAAMRATLANYRDTRGLYRTWLAPRKAYQCLDPGRDSNPTDIAIQMHVYLMLQAVDAPAAQSLCGAMQRAFYDPDVWVYYAQAPLLPYVRAAELRQRGCMLPLPTERLASPGASLEIWSDLARRLVDAASAPPDAASRAAMRSLLARLGEADFARLRAAPPLLYHNDLYATVTRFYWSEDVGYALWLRLYAATLDATSAPP